MSSRPCRIQYSRWSLNTPSIGTTTDQILPQSTAIHSSSFCFPQTRRTKQELPPNYVNLPPLPPPPPSMLSPPYLSNYQRPKSTIFHDFTSTNQSTFHVNDFRQRCESKAVVGIVKPMVHQRSSTQLNNNNNNNHESKIPELFIDPCVQSSIRSLYPPQTPTIPPPPPLSSASPSIVYRSRPIPSYNNINSQPPMVPRRYSSISNNKCLSSHRSSRTTSTSSSSTAVNELPSTTLSHEIERQQEQQRNDNRILVDVKRLEMFYGSVGTLVKSARSIARLYTTTSRQLANFEDWSCQKYGVPVWIYNTGANLKRTRQIRLLLAHHESCFAVWSSLVSDQAEIRIPRENYMTCWLPESSLLVVFKFEYDETCRLFFRHYYEMLELERRKNLTNPPPLPAQNSTRQQQQQRNAANNHKEIPRRYSRLRTMSNKQDKEQFDLRRCRSLSKIRTVKKSDISGPINFEHISHIGNSGLQERPSIGTGTLRSLHASMSHLPSNDTLTDRCGKQSKIHISTLFVPHTTAV